MAAAPQQFCVRWNSYHTNLQAVFPRLLLTEQFADVTLACESRQLRCHKLVLSACSAYLERLLLHNPCDHPIVLMRDMRFSEMQALVDFMYKGEVNVTQEELPSLLKSAEALQIRGLCSGEAAAAEGARADSTKDFTVASDALVAHATGNAGNGPAPAKATPNHATPNGHKKRKSEERPEVKEETVEEDGLYYGELDPEHMEYNEDEEPGKPGSSLGQTSEPSEFAIANVQCQYDSPSDTESVASVAGVRTADDHTYDTRDEPPAFIIHQTNNVSQSLSLPSSPFVEVRPKIMTIGPSHNTPAVNVIHVGDRPQIQTPQSTQPEFNINKRIRRSEVVLRQAADCVSRGLTFQTVSEQFNIPISTIRFFMARKGILPRRRRGRSTQLKPCSSPEPPFHMQHFKLPHMLPLTDEPDN
ncbi:protein bric-a-brac 2-like isoform X8 [Ostrinia furnacalis]|uniref:protein bric-a-brac 2-like isoform X7 n=1 Tax=Ostrinia furnacalis TaxID=93504 RepID=UPI00103AFA91|nr:protein bric-a-brac 2-like isoform X7 [Ostrinia furnacalis]XP_028160210.1 protein bric-a-brac 2-like isoform X8 [Ostrinia furnacalis]